MLKKITVHTILVATLFLVLGCDNKDKDEEIIKLPVNYFSMQLNGKTLNPLGSDPCTSAYNCEWTGFNDRDLYTISAFFNRRGIDESRDDSQLRIQIIDVEEPGVFIPSGSYKSSFETYALFVERKDVDGIEHAKMYVNKTDQNSFFVHVDEIIPVEGRFVKGIKGTFYGTLYNEADPSDFIVIEKGDFIFELLNNSGRHCK